MTRRGFFGRLGGALAAVLVAPRALFKPQSFTTLSLSTTVALTNIPVSSDSGVTGRRIYRSYPRGPGEYTLKLVRET